MAGQYEQNGSASVATGFCIVVVATVAAASVRLWVTHVAEPAAVARERGLHHALLDESEREIGPKSVEAEKENAEAC